MEKSLQDMQYYYTLLCLKFIGINTLVRWGIFIIGGTIYSGNIYNKVKEVGDLMTGESATEGPVNGGRNYNDPKVAKFLVG